MNIVNIIFSVHVSRYSRTDDKLIWGHSNNGEFTVKYPYSVIAGDDVKHDWKWKAQSVTSAKLSLKTRITYSEGVIKQFRSGKLAGWVAYKAVALRETGRLGSSLHFLLQEFDEIRAFQYVFCLCVVVFMEMENWKTAMKSKDCRLLGISTVDISWAPPQDDLVRSSSARLCPPSILIGKKRAVQLRILGPLFPAAPFPPSSVGCVWAWSGIYRAADFFFSDLLSVAIGVAGVLGSGVDRFSWLRWVSCDVQCVDGAVMQLVERIQRPSS
ncbi:hypothetical protein ACOSP7_003744 [Xanthoceras sorbifolium]